MVDNGGGGEVRREAYYFVRFLSTHLWVWKSFNGEIAAQTAVMGGPAGENYFARYVTSCTARIAVLIAFQFFFLFPPRRGSA
jgi:hypothetical protein